MGNKIIVTIGRQFGSGGHEIGKRLSQKLDIPFLDKELITLAAKESGYSEKLFEEVDERPTNSFLYSIAMGSYIMGNNFTGAIDMPLNDKLFMMQSDIIQNKAMEGSCIIVGRCADYVLKDTKECINIFIHADLDKRIQKVMQIKNIEQPKAKEIILKSDKTRANYYNYFTNAHWGKAENYHLCVNSGLLGIENSVLLIKKYIELKQV